MIVSVDVRRIVVEHDLITMYDDEGRETLMVDHPSHPGAGLGLEIAEHAEFTEAT